MTKIAMVSKLVIERGDSFHDSFRYQLVGVYAEDIGRILKGLVVREGIEQWPQCHLAGQPLFKVVIMEPGNADDASALIEAVIEQVETGEY